MDILSAKQVREMDRAAIAGGMPGIKLMENAGRGFVEVLLRYQGSLSGLKAVIFTGKGNNGGDGFVIARHVKKLGGEVCIVALAGAGELKGDALKNYRKIKKFTGVEYIDGVNAPLDEVKQAAVGSDFVVDAIFGTGFRGKITGRVKEVVKVINDSGVYVIACDIPSGVNGDTGEDGGGTAVNADMTITFAYPKQGLFLLPGSRYAGNIEVVDIGLGKSRAKSGIRMITGDEIRVSLKKRGKDLHKNDFGHLLVLAGSAGMTGAAALTCLAALRMGAGLVTLGIPESLNDILEVKLTEAMTFPLPETDRKALSPDAFKPIVNFIKDRKVSALAVGPGLSANEETGELVRRIVSKVNLPCVLDADGINAFSGRAAELKKAKAKIIITPHTGELARLTGRASGEIQKDRLKTAKDFAKSNNLICVLKGYQTVISDGNQVCINPTGNPGMASGGTGDVLTGMIAGRLCQEPARARLDAVRAGVYLHGLAGDIAREEKGEISLIASDIIDEIPEAIRFTG